MIAEMQNHKPLQVAIIGAGIGGLALAVALVRIVPEGLLKVNVYEQAHEIKEIGSGVFFWPRTWSIFQRLGVADAFAQHLTRKPDNSRTLVWKVKKGDRAQVANIFELYQDGVPSPFHRATVQKTLLDALPSSVQVHLCHRLVSYDETNDKVYLKFENKESHTCDLLIGADGIKSHTRAEFIRKRLPDELESVNPVWGGTVVYRSLINAEKIREIYPEHTALSSPVMYTGDGKYCVGYPIDNGKFIYIAVLATDYSKEGTRFDGPTVESADKEQILRLFDGWTDEFLELLKHIETTSKWTVQYLNVPSNFAVGRVALLGDAAHAMPPNLGSGAGQAIEDAYTLAHLLSKAVQDDIPIHRVTAAYTEARRPLANLVLERSRDMGRLVSFRALGYENIENADVETMKTLFERFASDFEGMFAWSKAHPVENEVAKALNML